MPDAPDDDGVMAWVLGAVVYCFLPALAFALLVFGVALAAARVATW